MTDQLTTPLQVTARLRTPVTEHDHIRGPHSAPVTIVQYGDFQCPFCGLAHANLTEVLRQRADTVRHVYRHFPITNVHPYAERAAEAAEAPGGGAGSGRCTTGSTTTRTSWIRCT